MNNLIGDVPLTLIVPWDCGFDQVTFGAMDTKGQVTVLQQQVYVP